MYITNEQKNSQVEICNTFMIKERFFIATFITTGANGEVKFPNKICIFSVVFAVKFAVTEISRKWKCPTYFTFKSPKKVG